MGNAEYMGTFSGLSLATKKSLWVSHVDYVLLASTSLIVVNKGGTIRNTKRPILEPAGRPIPSVELPMPRESSSRKCKLFDHCKSCTQLISFLYTVVLKPNSLTLPFVSA